MELGTGDMDANQPDGGEIREYLTTRNVVAESLDGLMGGLKLASDEVHDAGRD